MSLIWAHWHIGILAFSLSLRGLVPDQGELSVHGETIRIAARDRLASCIFFRRHIEPVVKTAVGAKNEVPVECRNPRNEFDPPMGRGRPDAVRNYTRTALGRLTAKF